MGIGLIYLHIFTYWFNMWQHFWILFILIIYGFSVINYSGNNGSFFLSNFFSFSSIFSNFSGCFTVLARIFSTTKYSKSDREFPCLPTEFTREFCKCFIIFSRFFFQLRKFFSILKLLKVFLMNDYGVFLQVLCIYCHDHMGYFSTNMIVWLCDKLR